MSNILAGLLCFIVELQHVKRASGAQWVRIFVKPMRPKKFGSVRPPTHPCLQTCMEVEGSPNAIRTGGRRMLVQTEGDGEKSQCR